ncbi:MAG: translation initiation factor IF-2 [Candidatus Omnitrophica bacterium]|nr:translation initiation factor IF-2 [Candidatus Omnitrophota bacterium]
MRRRSRRRTTPTMVTKKRSGATTPPPADSAKSGRRVASPAAPPGRLGAAGGGAKPKTVKAKPATKAAPIKTSAAKKPVKATPPTVAAPKPAVKVAVRPVTPTAPVVTRPSPVAPPAAKVMTKPAPAAPPRPAAPAPVAAKLPPAPPPVAPPPPSPAPVVLKPLEVKLPISVKDLATKLEIKVNDLIKRLLQERILVTINQAIDEAVVRKIAREQGYEITKAPTPEEAILQSLEAVDPAKLKPRAPVVTLMGHVDHGKTSLLDAIRQARVAQGEAGGITQHIGAYEVTLPQGKVAFLDTPGHEAFTAMRARGANVTDIVVLVVAADDGVMPQTIEAIDHAKAAGVTLVVAVNKIDKPEANPERVKKQLMELGLMPEEWGGKTIMVGVSAKTGQGIKELLEMLLLEAELLELKADPTRPAMGAVLEAELSKGTGPTAHVLVQSGTIRVGELIVAGQFSGRIRAMINDRGQRVKEAGPATPVEVLGLSGVPQAGDRFFVVADEKQAREIVERRTDERRLEGLTSRAHVTLEDLHARIAEGKQKELKLIIKGDVQGSLEALRSSLEKVSTEEIKLITIHAGIGDINESDVMLAAASDAVIFGFHVGVDAKATARAEEEGVEIKRYPIIYDAVNAVKAAIEGLLEPELEETFLGRALVRKIFVVSKVGIVAGCYVAKGKLLRNSVARVLRGAERVYEGKIGTLKRLKDDVREVGEGFECGITLEGFPDLQEGDVIEAVEVKKVARKLA